MRSIAALSLVALFAAVSLYFSDSSFHIGRSLLSKSSSSSDEDSGCQMIHVAEKWWDAFQRKDYDAYSRLYHRNALRYENGELLPVTKGVPLTSEQFKCMTENVHFRVALRHLGRDKSHKFIGIGYDMFVEDSNGYPVYVSLEFEHSACKISVERYFFDAATVGFNQLVSRTTDDCFGGKVAPLLGLDKVNVIDTFWRGFLAKNFKIIRSTFTDAPVAYLNGQKLVEFFSEDWMNGLLSTFDVSNLNVVSTAINSNVITQHVTYDYNYKATILKSQSEGTANLGVAYFFNAAGLLSKIVIVSGSQHGEVDVVGMAESVFTPKFKYSAAADEIKNSLAFLGKPSDFVNGNDDGTGHIHWEDAKMCLGESYLYDMDGSAFLVVSARVPLSGDQIETLFDVGHMYDYTSNSEIVRARVSNYAEAVAYINAAALVANGATVEQADKAAKNIINSAKCVLNDGVCEYSPNFYSNRDTMCKLIAKL